MPYDSLDRWFAYEVLSHEGALMGWLRGISECWDELHELRQETYVRTYKAAATLRLTGGQRLLMASALELMQERGCTQERPWPRRSYSAHHYDRPRLPDDLTLDQCMGAHRQLSALAETFDRLPSPYREVVWTRRVEEWSQKDLSARLGAAKPLVETYIAQAVRRLADGLFAADYSDHSKDAGTGADSESIQLEEDAARSVARADWIEGLDVEEALELVCSETSLAHRVAYIRLDAAWRQSRRLKVLVHGVPLDEVPPPRVWRYPGF